MIFQQAKKVQVELAAKVSLVDELGQIEFVAGMDVSYMPFDPGQMIHGVAVLLKVPSMEVVEVAGASMRQTFPYRTGFLGFREVPVLLEAFGKLKIRPDVVFLDGHGVCHPKGLGVASHFGVLADVPTIGVAKSRLIGEAKEPVGEEKGSVSPLIWKGKEVGALVRSKRGCLPLIISPGHKVSMQRAVEEVLKGVRGYRLPEMTRLAHEEANRLRKLGLT